MSESHWMSASAPYTRPRPEGDRDAWTEEAARRGHTGTNQLREVAEVRPPSTVAEFFDLRPGDVAVVRRRLVLLDGRPSELADSYYPAALARGTRLAEPRKIPGGAITLLAQLGHHPGDVEERVRARPATEDEQHELGIGENQWVLILTRLLRSTEGVPAEATVMTMIADDRELRYKMIIE
ncbi:UTRA domain-containing protein [Nonomuraea sp. NPDC055795]